jgi:endonuclease YncB( thermonuclease family)
MPHNAQMSDRVNDMQPLRLFLFALWSFTAWAEVLKGRVVGVANGDTITLLDGNRHQHRIRLAGIDPPEKGQALRSAFKATLV